MMAYIGLPLDLFGKVHFVDLSDMNDMFCLLSGLYVL